MTDTPHGELGSPGPEELREQVERTRQDLGRTVEALAAKTDVKARARDKAADVRERAEAKAHELKAKTADVAHHVQDTVQDKVAHPVKDKAAHAAGVARDKAVRTWQDKTPDAVPGAVPETVWHTAAGTGRGIRDPRALLLAAGGVAAVVWLVCRRRKG
ncbi:DUF3618 domain-containing protein [Streptomyces sp. NPDC006711]|uniref:DUF3618 domain-containing protein n=1 Tax=unclassified Streptomyces TaxID=2593676 RepID=UPI00340160E3